MIRVVPHQETLALAFLLIAFISVPLMLCVKPCYLGCCVKHEHHDHKESAIHDSKVEGEGT